MSPRDLVPPLAPPFGAHEDAELGVPAVRDVGGVLEVVEAVVALLVAGGRAFEHRVGGEVTQLHGELLVDLLGLGIGDDVVGHGGRSYPVVWMVTNRRRWLVPPPTLPRP